jgi:acetolactate synthase-1/2/3 large subunit
LLEIPRDIGGADIDEASLGYSAPRGYRAAGDPALIDEATTWLLSAQRPILHVGHGALWSGASAELIELVELTGVPVMTTMAGKSVFPEDHPLALGAGGHTITRAAAHFLKKADLVFGIGCSFTKGGFSAPIPDGKRLIQVTLSERDIDKDYPIDLAIIGDARLVLKQLIAAIRQRGAGRLDQAAVRAEIEVVRAAEFAEWGPRLTSDETPINPYRVIWDLTNTVDRARTILTHDSGNPRDQTLPFYRSLAPRGYLGWGKSTQLGTGLGLAMGAKLAQPAKTVINIMGDLAFGTAGMDVETAVRERIPIITVLLNNSRMGGYGHHMPVASQRFQANRLSGNYAAVAAGLGAYSERVEQPAEIIPALKRAMAANTDGRPAVLEFITKEEPVYPAARAVIDSIK